MNKEKRNDCIAVYGNLIEITKNGQLTTDELGQLVVAMYDYELEEIEPDIAEKTQPFQFAWSFILPSLRARKRRQGRNARYQENKKLKEMAQNEVENQNDYKDIATTTNAPIYPINHSKNQECDDEVNVTASNPIEIDDNEEEMNVIESTDFIVGNDDEDDFRELLRDNVDLLGCMSYDGLTKHKVAYDFLANSAITRQRVDNILSEERKRRMESKWKIA